MSESATRVDIVGKEDEWPGMGVIVARQEIEDDLQRAFLPREFASMSYARPGTKVRVAVT
jgi:hypothetical protein